MAEQEKAASLADTDECPICGLGSNWVTVCGDVIQLVCPAHHEWSLPIPSAPLATVTDHLSGHLTDGRFHDDCAYCRQRRRLGGTGTEALCDAQDDKTWWPAVAVCRRLNGHEQPEHFDPLYGVTWPSAAPDAQGASDV